MKEQNEKQPEIEIPKWVTYITLVSRMTWALLVLFGIMGVMMGNDGGVAVLVISAVVWVSINILTDGLVAYALFRQLRTQEQNTDEIDKE